MQGGDDGVKSQSPPLRFPVCPGRSLAFDSWGEVNLALRWLGLQYLKDRAYALGPQQLAVVDSRVSELVLWDTSREKFLVSTDDEEDAFSERTEVKLHWFTSLWTLQEAVLCPDRELYTKCWASLTDDWGHAITLKSR